MGESVSKWEIGDSSDDEFGVFADTPVHPDNKMSGIQSFVGIKIRYRLIDPFSPRESVLELVIGDVYLNPMQKESTLDNG